MIKQFLIFFCSLIVLASCGTKKEVITMKSKVSTSDYPYITLFHEAMRFKAQGRIAEAIGKLEECLLIRQNDDAVYFALSKFELQEGNRTKSADYIVRAAEIDPENTWYIQELAYMYYEQGNFERSRRNFKKLVSLEPRNVEWMYGYAEVLVKSGEPEKAIEALNKTEDQVGINPALSTEKYNLYMSIKQPDKAVLELDKAKEAYPHNPQIIGTYIDHYYDTKQPEKAVLMLEELIEADPNNGRAHLALADIYLKRNEEQKAYDMVVLAFQSPNIDLDTKMKILIQVHESSYPIDPKISQLAYEMPINHPTESKAYSIQADYYLRAEKEDEALKSYKKALALDKSSYPIWNQVLIMEYQAKMFDELYVDGKEAISLFPTNSTFLLLFGVAANQLKKHQEAIDVLSVGSEMVVNDKRMEAEFYGQLGEAYYGMGEAAKGKKNYSKAIQLDPLSSLLKNNFAYRLALSKIDLDLAISMAQQANETSPDQSHFIDTYGFVYFQKGEYANARLKFEKAYELNKEDKLIIEHLGDVEIKSGNTEKALEWWLKAKSMNSSNKNLDKKIQEKKYYEPKF